MTLYCDKNQDSDHNDA